MCSENKGADQLGGYRGDDQLGGYRGDDQLGGYRTSDLQLCFHITNAKS